MADFIGNYEKLKYLHNIRREKMSEIKNQKRIKSTPETVAAEVLSGDTIN